MAQEQREEYGQSPNRNANEGREQKPAWRTNVMTFVKRASYCNDVPEVIRFMNMKEEHKVKYCK